jgi:hypothetical protein
MVEGGPGAQSPPTERVRTRAPSAPRPAGRRAGDSRVHEEEDDSAPEVACDPEGEADLEEPDDEEEPPELELLFRHKAVVMSKKKPITAASAVNVEPGSMKAKIPTGTKRTRGSRGRSSSHGSR